MTTFPESGRLPSEIERRQIFHSLKRWSSYTAWHRILALYQAWVDAMEKTVSRCEDLPADSPQYQHYKQVGLGTDSFVSSLKGLADVDEGVARLKRGDKRVFKYASYGEFFRGAQPLQTWNHFINHFVKSDGWPLQPELIPHWLELELAREQVSSAWGECGQHVLQQAQDGTIERATRTFLNEYLKADLDRITFPHPLPEVPNHPETVLVHSGNLVKQSGIWEPVDAPAPKLISLFKPSPPQGPFPIVGTMAYLHAGTEAPNMASYGEIDGERCTWRLLWRDTRYEDGTIPEEEQHYIFLKPEASTQTTLAQPTTVYASSMTLVESGWPAPATGRWLVEDDLCASVDLNAGEVLPLHQGRSVRWILAAA